MKRNFFFNTPPRGQALLEMTVMLVAIVAILLGVIYIGGLTIANNQLLLSAKLNAEKASRLSGASSESGSNELLGWNYTTLELSPNETLTIPFLADDRLSASGASTLSTVSSAFRDSLPSEADLYDYSWHSPRDFDRSLGSDFTDWVDTGLGAASLVGGTDSVKDPVSGFDRGSAGDTSSSMRSAFRSWFGITISDKMLNDIPSNQVYMPRVNTSED